MNRADRMFPMHGMETKKRKREKLLAYIEKMRAYMRPKMSQIAQGPSTGNETAHQGTIAEHMCASTVMAFKEKTAEGGRWLKWNSICDSKRAESATQHCRLFMLKRCMRLAHAMRGLGVN